MKRTCEGCRALVDVQGYGVRCELGYKMNVGIPLEECSKPKSNMQFIKALNKKKTKTNIE